MHCRVLSNLSGRLYGESRVNASALSNDRVLADACESTNENVFCKRSRVGDPRGWMNRCRKRSWLKENLDGPRKRDVRIVVTQKRQSHRWRVIPDEYRGSCGFLCFIMIFWIRQKAQISRSSPFQSGNA